MKKWGNRRGEPEVTPSSAMCEIPQGIKICEDCYHLSLSEMY